jgi:hypothetical protein
LHLGYYALALAMEQVSIYKHTPLFISIKTENSHFGKLSRPASPSLSCFDLWLLFSNRTLLPIQLAARALLSRSVISTRHRSSSLTGFLFPLPLLWLCGDTDSTATDAIDQPHPAVYFLFSFDTGH